MLALQRQAARATRAFSSVAAAATGAAAAENPLLLQVQVRETEGSRASRRLRKNGFLPGVIYGEGADGSNDRVLVALETRAFEKIHRKLWTSVENQLFTVQIGDSAEPVKAFMRDVTFDPGTLGLRHGHERLVSCTN